MPDTLAPPTTDTVATQPVAAAPTVTFDPLDGNPAQQEYTKHNIDQNNLPVDIPEPTFQAPPEMDLSTSGQNEPVSGPATETATFNKHYEELGAKDKKIAAENAADSAIQGYAFVCHYAANIPKMNKTKIQKKILDGVIDGNMQFPVDSDGTLQNINQYADTLNAEIDDAFRVTEEFEQEIKPPLMRVLEKKGLAMTDENRIMFILGKDLASKAIAAFQLVQGQKAVLRWLEEASKGTIQSSLAHTEPSPQSDVAPVHTSPDPEIVPASHQPEVMNFTIEHADSAGKLHEDSLSKFNQSASQPDIVGLTAEELAKMNTLANNKNPSAQRQKTPRITKSPVIKKAASKNDNTGNQRPK